jgi:hypothetical protein
MHMTCERCGATDIRRVRVNPIERFLRIFHGKKRFFCTRCGWSALRDWDETAPVFVPPPRKTDLKLVMVSAHAHRAEMDSRR